MLKPVYFVKLLKKRTLKRFCFLLRFTKGYDEML